MAQSGFTPIQHYRSATPGASPSAVNLADGELALNTADEKLFFKNSSGSVVSIAVSAAGTVTSVAASGGTTGLTFTGSPITTSGTLTLGGTLAVANGGTGATTLTGVVKGNGTSAFTAGTVSLTSEVSGALPVANGGTGATAAGTARTNLGATTLGGNLFTLANPSAVTFPRFNADNTVSARTAAQLLSDIGGVSGITQGSATWNTALGSTAGAGITSGTNNTLVGGAAGAQISTGANNVAIGYRSVATMTGANENTLVGVQTLDNTGGSAATGQTAVGYQALRNAFNAYNTAVGHGAGSNITSGANNTVIGYNSAASSATVSNEITLGNSNVTNFRVPGVDFSVNTTTGVLVPKTVTAAGTTGAQTINKTAGSVNFAAAATSLVVTNSFVSTNSVIVATVATNDSTMKSVAVVAGSGSFTLHANAAATAETRVNFVVLN